MTRPCTLRPVILIATLLLIAVGCATDGSAAEKTAIEFYKSVWVNGNLNKASSLLENRGNLRDIRWRVEDTRGQRKNPAILITESPTDSKAGNSRTFLIHRPSDKRDFKVRVRKNNGRWKVTKFEQNYIRGAGGYISNDAYQRLQQEFPGLRWKRIVHP